MSLVSIWKSQRAIGRATQIARVLLKHGFAHVVHGLNLEEHLPVLRRLLRGGTPAHHEPQPIAGRLVQAMEELGPTFVKLGQLLSTRPDIIPENFIHEFRKLQDDVQPFDSKQALTRVEEELEKPILDTFSEFEETPRASGSIGQAHFARLLDGSRVVMKIKRPGIEREILSDFDILAVLAQQAERVPELQPFRPAMLVDECARSVRRELDFVTEGSYTEKFRQNFADDPRVCVPKIYWEYSTSNILTLQWVSGCKLREIMTQSEPTVPYDKRSVAAAIMQAFMRQFFEFGLFHADPHPGNLLLCDNGALGVIDFGMVGHLTSELRDNLGITLVALVRKDLDLIVDICSEIGVFSPETDGRELKPALLEMIDKFYGVPLKRLDPPRVFSELMRVAREHRVIFPRDFVLLAKAMVTVVGTARTLDPDFDFAVIAAPYGKKLLKEKLSPQRFTKSVGSSVWHISHLLRHAPREARELVRKVLSGSLQFALRHEGLENFMHEVDRASNRVAVSIILAAIILASSLIIHAKVGPLVLDDQVSALGLGGYLLALPLGFWLVVGILRSGRL